MKLFYLLSICLLFLGLTSCSFEEGIALDNRIPEQNYGKQNSNWIDFQKSYNIWIQKTAKMNFNREYTELSNNDHLIVEQAYNLLLSYGYDQEKLDIDLENNAKILIAEAVRLYVTEIQVQF